MKPSYLLLNVVLIAAGLFVYHTVVGAPEGAPSAYDHLESDHLGDLPADRAPDPILLDSGADAALARNNANRIATLEGLLAVLKGRTGEGEAAADPAFASTGGSAMPSLSSGDLVDVEDPVFDERTLKSLAVYLDEINRRKMEARNKTRLENELTRLGVDLSDNQRESVVDATMAYQQKTRDLLKQGWSKDDAGKEQRKKAFGGLKDEYVTTLNTLVPAVEAEKISGSRMSRGYGGFTGGGRRATRAGGGNREKKRNRK
jgi:hypothetical protein